MALDTINVGNFVNDGTGDDLRSAFVKINNNFEELDLLQGQNNTISNVGTGLGIYKEKIGVDLKLRSLKGGDGIDITTSPNELLITNTYNSFLTVDADTGSVTASNLIQSLSIVGGAGVTTSITDNVLTIEGNDYILSNDPAPTLGGDLDLNGYNIVGGGSTITVDTINGSLIGDSTGTHTGDVIGNVYGIDIRDVYEAINIFDFGTIDGQVTNPAQWILASINIDMGSFTNPATIGLECGTII
jgi:hypothetical protein